MADKGTPGDGPSLEMPSLPFWRRKRSSDAPDDTAEAAAAESPTAPLPVTGVEPPVQAAPRPQPSLARPAEAPLVQALPAQPQPAAPHRVEQRAADEDLGPRRTPRLPGLPGLTGAPAALATGAVVGALGVLLVWLASLGCEAARGTASCGDGPGFLVLAAVLAVLAYVGSVLLRGFGVPDAGSTSLLAVGVMAVLVLVLLTDSIFAWWTALAVPGVSAAAYALSWWVSTRAVATDDDAPSRL